ERVSHTCCEERGSYSHPLHTHVSSNMALELAHENIWFDKWRVDDAERQFYENKAQGSSGLGSLASQIAKARQEIKNSLVSRPSSLSFFSTVYFFNRYILLLGFTV
ncbi:hypothetical protein OTU49_010276, partial [Cherax quadricarinatus]